MTMSKIRTVTFFQDKQWEHDQNFKEFIDFFEDIYHQIPDDQKDKARISIGNITPIPDTPFRSAPIHEMSVNVSFDADYESEITPDYLSQLAGKVG